MLASVGGVDDADVLAAAILHDTIEDTPTTIAEIGKEFGAKIQALVAEVTDPPGLKGEPRREWQVSHVPHISEGAKLIKLADKIGNVFEMATDPGDDWDRDRRERYFRWAEHVLKAMGPINQPLEDLFAVTLRQAMSTLQAELPFKVIVADNFHYRDEREWWEKGAYATYDEALAAAKRIVEDSVRHCFSDGMTAEAVFENYQSFGDDPFIRPAGAERFSARDYARAFAGTIAPRGNAENGEAGQAPRKLRCVECGTENQSGEIYCERCGADLPISELHTEPRKAVVRAMQRLANFLSAKQPQQS